MRIAFVLHRCFPVMGSRLVQFTGLNTAVIPASLMVLWITSPSMTGRSVIPKFYIIIVPFCCCPEMHLQFVNRKK